MGERISNRMIKASGIVLSLGILAGCGSAVSPPDWEYTVTVSEHPSGDSIPSVTATPTTTTPDSYPVPTITITTEVPAPQLATPGTLGTSSLLTSASPKTSNAAPATPNVVTKVDPNWTTDGCGNPTRKVAFSFDDGAPESYTQKITSILKEDGVGATFYVNGDVVPQSEVSWLRQLGFFVGDHTWDHADMSTDTVAEVEQAMKNGTPSNLFRPPYGGFTSKGVFNQNIATAAKALGNRDCLWDVDSRDWTDESVEKIDETVNSEIRHGSVILMHDHEKYTNTVAALPGLIAMIRKEGYQICGPSPTPTKIKAPLNMCY